MILVTILVPIVAGHAHPMSRDDHGFCTLLHNVDSLSENLQPLPPTLSKQEDY